MPAPHMFHEYQQLLTLCDDGLGHARGIVETAPHGWAAHEQVRHWVRAKAYVLDMRSKAVHRANLEELKEPPKDPTP